MNCETTKLPNVSEVVFQPPPPRSAECEMVPIKRPEPKKHDEHESPPQPKEQILKDDDDCKNVTVKFDFNGNQVIGQAYPVCITIGEIKHDLGRRFEVDPELLILSQCSRIQSDECALKQTCINEYHIYEFDLKLKTKKKRKKEDKDKKEEEKDKKEEKDKTDEKEEKEEKEEEKEPQLDINVYYSKHRLPDFITVCMDEDEEKCHIPVAIHDESIIKPIFCTYVDNTTGPYSGDTMHDQTAQCFLDGNNIRHWIESDDYYITPGKYQTYAQKMRAERKMYKIILIQRNFRRFKWQRWMGECAREYRYQRLYYTNSINCDYRRLVANRISEEESFKKAQEIRKNRIERAKQFPRTKNDFDVLLGEVQKWKTAEMKRINSMYEGAPRVAEINILLNKEIEMLNNIERQRNFAQKSMEESRQKQTIEKMGEPIKWIGYNDTIIHLDLMRTQRVRFLNEIYNELCQDLPKEERLQLIDKVRALLLNEHCFPEFPELFELLDRERNLLMYTTCSDVSILRKRQNILFIDLIKFTEEPQPKRQDNRMCVVCKIVKPYSKFAIRTRQYQVDTCKKCFYLKVSPAENLIYASILRSIQREERRKRCNGSFAFILQMEDIRYLIKDVWHGHSIISKCEDRQRLRLPRWRKNEEWSPWNCVCLTENEARNHYRISELENTYDKKLILEVGNRQKLARSAFHNLAAVSTEFTETGLWWKVGLNPQRIVKLDDITSHKGADTLLQHNNSKPADWIFRCITKIFFSTAFYLFVLLLIIDLNLPSRYCTRFSNLSLVLNSLYGTVVAVKPLDCSD
uniref:IQ motif and ubiquitin-like domain-containing protein n=1 Tax=Glossina brevipalpis TaxID=37001 RepID=A0A1A9WNM7_9MUSC